MFHMENIFAFPGILLFDVANVPALLLNNLPTAVWILLVPFLLYRNAQGRELFSGLFDDTSAFASLRAAVTILMFHLLALAIFFVPTALFPDAKPEDLAKLSPVTGINLHIATFVCALPMIFFGLAMLSIQYQREKRWWKLAIIGGMIALSAFLSHKMLMDWDLGIGVLIALTAANMALCVLLIYILRKIDTARELVFWNYLAVALCMCLQIALIAGKIKAFNGMYEPGNTDPLYTPLNKPLYDALYLGLLLTVVIAMLMLSAAWNLQYVSPTFILMSVILFYLMLGDVIVAAYVLLALKWKLVLSAFLLLFIYVVFLRKWAAHRINLVESGIKADERADLSAYFKAWWETNILPNIPADESKEIPIFLLGAQGGGSRAGYWTSRLLNDQYEQFRHHLFAATSASGGSSGFGATLALWRYLDEHPTIPADRKAKILKNFARGMFDHNYLSGSFFQLLVTEVGKRIKYLFTKKGVFNRNYHHQLDEAIGFAQALERGWNDDNGKEKNFFQTSRERLKALFLRGYRDTLNIGKGGETPNYPFYPYLSYWYKPGGKLNPGLPLYFPITLNIQSGRAGYASPIDMKKNETVFIDAIDIVKEAEDPAQHQSIPLVAASHLSQLFPVLNAYTYIPSCGNFIDGGMYENQGLPLLSAIYDWLQAEIAQADFIPDALKRRIKVKLLLFVNGAVRPATAKQGPVVEKPISQISAIVKAAGFAGISGRTTWWNAYFKQKVGGNYEEFILQASDTPEKETVPLGRWISTRSFDKMEIRALEEQEQAKKFVAIKGGATHF